MIKKAVILCGGLATRFLPYCKSIPKEMLPVVNKPIIHYIVEELSQNGIKDILIVVGRNKDALVSYFDNNVELNNRLKETNRTDSLSELLDINDYANISYIRQIEPKGTGHGLQKAKTWVNNEPFLFLFGDNLFFNKTESLTTQLLNSYNTGNIENLISVINVDKDEVHKYGIIKPVYENDVHSKPNKSNTCKFDEIIEKPTKDKAPSTLANLGFSILSPEVFDEIDKLEYNGIELLLTDAINNLAKKGKTHALVADGTFLDFGYIEGFLKGNLFYAFQDEKLKESLIKYIDEIK